MRAAYNKLLPNQGGTSKYNLVWKDHNTFTLGNPITIVSSKQQPHIHTFQDFLKQLIDAKIGQASSFSGQDFSCKHPESNNCFHKDA